MATNYSYKDKTTGKYKDMVDYHNVVFWGKSAEIIGQYLSKGKRLLVQGKIQTRSWDDRDGTKKYKTEILGRDFLLLSPKDKTVPAVSAEEKARVEKVAEDVFGDAKPEPKPESEKETIKNDVKVDPSDIPF